MELLEAEIGCLTKRRRGPKPLSVRAKFAATAWLDGDILWREGRVVWRVDGREIVIGPRELESVSRALSSLQNHEKAAKRHCADFNNWHTRRLKQWQKARQLAAIRAPDLEALLSPSRRRNPAAIERLTFLLCVESSVVEPLLVSPARALFEAWPLSQEPLKCLLRDESQPTEARALGALVFGAALPLSPLPGEPLLRRAARYGARFGFPKAPQLVVALLKNGARDAEMAVARVEELLESCAPFAFDAAQLMKIHDAGKDADLVTNLAETVLNFPDPFPPLKFTEVSPKRFDLHAQRAISGQWNELRHSSNAEFRAVLAQIARRGTPRDLEMAFELLQHLVSAPLLALGTLWIEKGRLKKRRACESPAFENSAAAAVEEVLELLQAIAATPDLGVLSLLHQILPQCSACPVIDVLSPPAYAARWKFYAANQRKYSFAPLLAMARKFGVAPAREALRLGCWSELARHRELQPELFLFALEIKAWAPELRDDSLGRITNFQRYWNGAAGAKNALQPVMIALHNAPSSERALWLSEVLDGIEWSRRGARRQLPALARFLPAMRQVASASGEKLSPWTLIEVALELWEIAPDEEANIEARFRWVAEEMARQVAAPADEDRDWTYIAELVCFLSQLASRDEVKFRVLMSASWRFAHSDNDFKWSEVKRGAKLSRDFPALETTLSDNFVRCPARCFALLERLGPLEHFEPIRAPLQAWQKRAEVAPEVDWNLNLGGDSSWATRFVAAKRELEEAESPPAGVLKIAAWPQKMKRELAALQARSELPPHLEKRLKNLVTRLENREELHAAMRQEMTESLQNAAMEAELRVAERVVQSCYRTRLEVLGAPKNVDLTPDLINAALFSTDIELNRKWLREIVRHYCNSQPRDDWRFEIEGNARFLRDLEARGLNCEAWLSPAPQNFAVGSGNIELRLEGDPLQILQMGNYFDTCLSRGGCNAFSSVANAVELNKRVVFARDAKNRVVGRQLLALSREEKLLGFHVYVLVNEENSAGLRHAFGSYARDFAARCGLELGDKGEVERLFVSDWYDDGSINWSDLPAVEVQTQQIKLQGGSMQKKKNTAAPPVLMGRDAWIARLKAGETVSFREGGNSITASHKASTCEQSPSLAGVMESANRWPRVSTAA